MHKRTKSVICLMVSALLVVSLCGCQSAEKKSEEPVKAKMSLSGFAVYKEVEAKVTPSVKPYTAENGLSNIINKDDFAFSDEAENALIKNGFVVVPNTHSEFFSVYESNRYALTPNFVTTDAMLHNYHLYFSYLLRTMEKDYLSAELASLTKSMLEKSQEQYETLKGTDWENAAKRNVAYYAVAANILGLDVTVPSYVEKEVGTETKLILEHTDTFTASPVMNIGKTDAGSAEILNEDYTQYIPRGHYNKSETLQKYFKAMMWYGRMTFRALSADETRSAALTTLLMNEEENFKHWDNIYEPTNFFVGKSDDLGIAQYNQVLTDVYGKAATLETIIKDNKQWETFYSSIKKLEPPAINSMPIFDTESKSNRDEVIKGFRFMGQRFTLDASIFQRLVYREVKENSAAEKRMLPKGLDIPAAMGSKEAYSILTEMGETDYKNYPENMKQIQDYLSTLDTEAQTQNLYGSWLYTLTPLTISKGEGYPSFMQNSAWSRKQLETYLGSWTELKHDTILYAKQVYAEMGGGEQDKDDRGYVEPNPEVYGRLAALTRMTIEGLESRKLIDESTTASLIQLEELALMLKTISEKELTETALTDEEYDIIRSFGGQLEHFWLEALKDEGVDSPSSVSENPAALVADVATDPNGQVLEEATGHVNDIYAIVPVDGKLRLAKGAVYSYYEFPWPSDDRLTDEKWRTMLMEGTDVPETPSWTKDYTVPKGSEW